MVFYNLVDALGYGEGPPCKMAYLCEEVRSKVSYLKILETRYGMNTQIQDQKSNHGSPCRSHEIKDSTPISDVLENISQENQTRK